ncbi:hypothetical protein [Citricoccus sp. I39-566]|uniref:hypothetical protein n=1 Tax=Citricoccus sp. I39-566 TaxID=3073268 RepID=UPI00286D1028|nr:hypothetical protein [Citricoccus sp. I39-566]WMY77961.1 hypothetical protein RE421_14215 [Citricoccus sp. I39-566]
MRWPRSVFADTLEELAHEAELYFRPGTTYSIYSIREEGDEDRVTYRADALPPRSPGAARTRSTPGDGRTRVGRNLGHDAGPQTEPDGRQTPGGDIGPDTAGTATRPIDGRIAEPGAGPRAVRQDHAGPHGGHSAGYPTETAGRHRATGAVGAVNPETVTEIPGWAPESIPTQAFQAGPGLQAAYGLLMDGSGPGAEAGPAPATEPSAAHPTEHPAQDPTQQAVPHPAPRRTAAERRGGPAGVVPWFSTEDPELQEMLEHASPQAEGLTAAVDLGDPDAPLDSSGRRRTRLVFAGLLDDAVEAAERAGHRRWSAAGILNGGRPGAAVVCYGLGDGSDVTTLAQGLHRYAPMHLVLAVDPSRKHADTQAWVGQVAKVIGPASYVAVPRTVTGTPATVRDLGYRLHTPSEAVEILRR